MPGNLVPSDCGDGRCVMMSSGSKGGYWPGPAGAAEWGRTHGVDPARAVDRFHGIKQKDQSQGGGRGRDKYTVNPQTGDVRNPQGEDIGNLGDKG